jgi:DNA helicase II / ATP-dependent DNA helicase PcrA
MASDPDDMLAGLDDQQRAAVVHDELPLLVVAGAGSGKTRVLTRRIAWRIATGRDDPRRLLALTFTRTAATELQTRLRLLGVRDQTRAGTFHSIAWSELRTLRAERGRPAATLLDRPSRIVARLVPDGVGGRAVNDLVAELSWARARLVAPEQYPAAAAHAGRRPPLPAADVAELAHRYAEEKRRRGLVDFDDLLDQLADAVESDAAVAASQRWRTTHLYVDEYQDLNPLQDRLLRAWIGDGSGSGLCAVGDPNQAIYGWNGADPSLIERFAVRYPGASVLAVDRSYRSTPEVVATANALLDAGRCGGVRLRAVRAEGPVPVVAGYDDPPTEARAIARSCLDLRLPGMPWAHQAVLARTHAQLEVVEEALRGVGVPVRVGGRTPFVELPAVRGALREVAAAPDGFDAALARLAGAVEDAEAPDESLVALVALAETYRASERRPDAGGLRAWVVANADDGTGGGDGVELRTFHAAKGLEWPIVHVCGVEDGLVPFAGARTPEALAEERRLLYVAITRAERVLRLTWATRRRVGTDEKPRRPSPYLADLRPALERMASATTTADWRSHLPEVRAARRRPGPSPADERAELLRAWRHRRARAAGVPAAAVLPDHVLRAIVAADPAAPEEVAAVDGTGHLVAAGLVDDLLVALGRTQ